MPSNSAYILNQLRPLQTSAVSLGTITSGMTSGLTKLIALTASSDTHEIKIKKSLVEDIFDEIRKMNDYASDIKTIFLLIKKVAGEANQDEEREGKTEGKTSPKRFQLSLQHMMEG